MLYEVEDNGQ